MPLDITARQEGKVRVLELSGRLEIGDPADKLDKMLQESLAEGHLALLLDCNQVSFIDSRGMQVLVRAVVSAKTRGARMKLLNPSGRVLQALTITRLLTVIESFDNQATALESFDA